MDLRLEGLIRGIYDGFVRPRLPWKISVHNGVAVRHRVKLLDNTDKFPQYEAELVSEIRAEVHEGDRVCVVGGGLGVSTVAAVEATGRKGSVKTYEGSEDQIDIVKKTLELNQVGSHVELRHGVVGSFSDFSSDFYGKAGSAAHIEAKDLPESEVLVLDCEGAENEIIDGLADLPPTIIVESHGFLDSPESEVRQRLESRGYQIRNRAVEQEKKGIVVLTASKVD
ncbi:class I SAM-dependent methyltransferase [Halorubrum amylolyticum]|uniref:FkbM family methyltransferase n=1 Tax=Halorubrum amylolyticum TaxID=2508724 RepID=UPI00100918D4|nr:FkbM family methyltransferase [Halorubrum amylolyticum]